MSLGYKQEMLDTFEIEDDKKLMGRSQKRGKHHYDYRQLPLIVTS